MTTPRKAERKCKSPYCRKGKTPHQYSEHYRRWKHAVMTQNPEEAAREAFAHAKQFHYLRTVMEEVEYGLGEI